CGGGGGGGRCELGGGRRARREAAVIARVQTEEGVVAVDLEDETVLEVDAYASVESQPEVPVPIPRVLATAASGSTVICLVDAKPPLLVSHDAGRTWRESGRRFPSRRAVAGAADDPG